MIWLLYWIRSCQQLICILKTSLRDTGTYLHCSRIRHGRKLPPSVYCLPIHHPDEKRIELCFFLSSTLHKYSWNLSWKLPLFSPSELEVLPEKQTRVVQWESNSLCRCKYRLWQYSLLCGVCLFFSEKVMENKLALNILLQRHYLNINTNFKPFVLIVGYFFPCTREIPKINLGQNFIFRKTSCAELW